MNARPTAPASDDPTLVGWTVEEVMAELAPHIDALQPGDTFDVLARYRNESPMFWSHVVRSIRKLLDVDGVGQCTAGALRYDVDTLIDIGLPSCSVRCLRIGELGIWVRKRNQGACP